MKKVAKKIDNKVTQKTNEKEKVTKVAEPLISQTEDKQIDVEQEVKLSVAEEVLSLSDQFSMNDILDTISDLNFYNSESTSDDCLNKACDNPPSLSGYCRLHYIENWKEIKRKQSILSEGKLQLFIEELVKKYPVKYIEEILMDLSDEQTFFNSLKEMDIDSEDVNYDNLNDSSDDDIDITIETKSGMGPSLIGDD